MSSESDCQKANLMIITTCGPIVAIDCGRISGMYWEILTVGCDYANWTSGLDPLISLPRVWGVADEVRPFIFDDVMKGD